MLIGVFLTVNGEEEVKIVKVKIFQAINCHLIKL